MRSAISPVNKYWKRSGMKVFWNVNGRGLQRDGQAPKSGIDHYILLGCRPATTLSKPKILSFPHQILNPKSNPQRNCIHFVFVACVVIQFGLNSDRHHPPNVHIHKAQQLRIYVHPARLKPNLRNPRQSPRNWASIIVACVSVHAKKIAPGKNFGGS